MKRTVTKIISILLSAITCFSVLPLNAFAWGKMTHVYTANIIKHEVTDGSYATVRYPADTEIAYDSFQFDIPEEYLRAIALYPGEFRAGALGPDLYPDIITGQMYIHPEYANIDSGEWITLLCEAVNKMGKDTEERKAALSFTLGCMLHYCGDLFGHDFVNTFSGGSFPSLASLDVIDLKGERLNNILSHLSLEKYMDNMIYPTYEDGKADAPNRFVSNTLVFNGSPAAGLAPLYKKYPAVEIPFEDIESDLLKDALDDFFDENGNNVPPHYTAMLALRDYVTASADKYRENMDPASAAITRYCDEWAEDIDRGIIEFTAACDNIARRMVTGEKNKNIEWKKFEEELENGVSIFDEVYKDLIKKGLITKEMVEGSEGSSIVIIKEELGYWWDEYGVYMIGIPDIIIDGIEFPVIEDVIDMLTLGWLWDLIGNKLKEWCADEISKYIFGMSLNIGLTGEDIAEMASKITARLDDPEVQLDHKDNPYKPSEDNFADLMEYLDSLPEELKYTKPDSEFEALYNTITMFKLVLMGPENYTRFIERYAGVQQTSYHMNTARLEASSLMLEFKTSDLYLSGTNDNIYVIVYRVNENGTKTGIVTKLLDISGKDDFEAGDTQTYEVQLPESVRLDELEIALKKTPAFDFLPALTDDWCCENIRVTPMYAGYAITEPIDLGGIRLKGICKSIGLNFREALKAGRDAETQSSQPVTDLKVQIKVKDKMYAGTDSDIYLRAYNGNIGYAWQSVLLDKAMYNDLERGDNDTYVIPIVIAGEKSNGIPLDKLRIEFDHTGIDEANWEEVTVTPCYGSLELTEPISLGGKKFEDTVWKTSFDKKVKKAVYKQYEPIETEYTTVLDDGLLSYMGSLDGGEEWVDDENELWADPVIRKKVFFEIFKGFGPEIEYTGEPTALDCDPVELVLELTGVWNGVSNTRRSQVKDLEHVYQVEGSLDVTFIDENGTETYKVSGVNVSDGHAFQSVEAGKLVPGYYDLKVYYAPNDADPTYSDTTVTFKRAIRVIAMNEPAAELAVKTQPKDVKADIGEKVTFRVEATGGVAPYSYQWQIVSGNNWRDADGSWSTGFVNSSFSFTVANDEFDTGYRYRCIITDMTGKTVTSDEVRVVEKTKPLEVVINNGEETIDYNADKNLPKTLTANAKGGVGPYTYTWYAKKYFAGPHEDWEAVSESSSYVLTPSVQSDLIVKVEVTDSTGKKVMSKEVLIKVTYTVN